MKVYEKIQKKNQDRDEIPRGLWGISLKNIGGFILEVTPENLAGYKTLCLTPL